MLCVSKGGHVVFYFKLTLGKVGKVTPLFKEGKHVTVIKKN